MKRTKKTKFITVFFIFIITATLGLYFTIRYKRGKPLQIAEKVLNSIATDNESPDIERYEQKYQEYFTAEAFEKALQQRSFSKFIQPTPYNDNYEKTTLNYISLEELEHTNDTIVFYATIQMEANSDEGITDTFLWNAQIRMTLENGSWKISHFKINSKGIDDK